MKKFVALFLFFSANAWAQSPCNVGDILFYDFSCGKELVEGKHPIAIVFAPVRRVAVSLNQISMQWSINQVDLEIEPPKGFMKTQAMALEEFSGQELASTFNKIAPNFYPAVRECSAMDWVKGQAWYLPEMGLLNQIYQHKNALNQTLNMISGADLVSDSVYWSGSQYSYSQSWQQNFFNGYASYNNNNITNNVRCVISY